MSFTLRSLLALVGGVASVAAVVIACGSDESKFDDGQPEPGIFGEAGFNESGGSQDDLYKNDPPPKWCGPGNVPAPPPPGGTELCPDDKNKPNCACTKPGEKAACWTGLRANRNLGICKDGTTTCVQKSENTFVWGPCEGQVLPDLNATKGKAACKCFSEGTWKLSNLSPCFITYTGHGAADGTYAVATMPDGKCPTIGPTDPPPPPAPAVWSTDTLKVDCAGKFKLCFRIKAGDFNNPQPSDCTVGEVCAPETDYVQADVEQQWPDLPGWLGKDNACAKKWNDTPATVSAGYGEMIVKGLSVRCDAIDDGAGGDLVFNRIQYCPSMCRDPANASAPECVACQQSGQGTF